MQKSPLIACVSMHQSDSSMRFNGQLAVTSRDIEVEWDGKTISLPLKGLKVHYGGSNDSLIFLAHEDQLEWTIFTRDRSIIETLRAVGDARLQAQLLALSRSRRRRLRLSLYTLGGIIALLFGLFALRNPVIGLVAELIPPSWERKLGEAVYLGVRAQNNILEDTVLTREFENLVSPLTGVLGDTGYTFEFHISQDMDLNAFALPGGIIVVNAGAILQAERTEELLGVLAHEISHVTKRHMTQQVITVFGLYLAVDVILGNIFGTVAAMSQGAMYLLQQGFSREHEQEADITGLNYLKKANIDPRGMIEFFKRVKAEQAKVPVLGSLEESLSFLSTHPATEDRIEYLAARIKEDGQTNYQALSKHPLEDFKTKLRAVAGLGTTTSSSILTGK